MKKVVEGGPLFAILYFLINLLESLQGIMSENKCLRIMSKNKRINTSFY